MMVDLRKPESCNLDYHPNLAVGHSVYWTISDLGWETGQVWKEKRADSKSPDLDSQLRNCSQGLNWLV